MRKFMQALFDSETTAEKAIEIGQAILAARSLRLTDISTEMAGSDSASYKRIQRFLQQADPRQALWQLFQEQAEFVIGDPTEVERRQARKTEYVGTLKDGKTKGFWALVLATPFRGRAIPCGLLTYSSKTIASHPILDSRNLNHFRAFAQLKDLLGERPLVLDREFSYLELLLKLMEEQVHFVIRLKLGKHPPKFWDADGREVDLSLAPGERVIRQQVWYKGEVCVNLIGTWGKGFRQPMWIMTNLTAEEGLRIYRARMKIDESFRDLKSLLGMTKLMNKRQIYMEKMVALLLLVYAIGLLVGERLRDYLYAEPISPGEKVSEQERVPGSTARKKGKKWKRYSGLFVLLKRKWSLSAKQWRNVQQEALTAFLRLICPPVPTHV
jgi:hypothetical protein